jgi:predicted glycosyltransferase involved in capsule biosynthesis
MKEDLKDVTFCIPVKLDSEIRSENLRISREYLLSNFETTVLVGEQAPRQIDYSILFELDPTFFYKTKILNELYKQATTPIVVSYDCDVILPVNQLLEAANKIRNGADFVYPFNSHFFDVDRSCLELLTNKKFDEIPQEKLQSLSIVSYGGCCFFNKERYRQAGYTNENFRSWGLEDTEIWYRLMKLNYSLDRVPGVVYHMTHPRGVDSSQMNPFHVQNYLEIRKIEDISAVDLRTYIDSWGWK